MPTSHHSLDVRFQFDLKIPPAPSRPAGRRRIRQLAALALAGLAVTAAFAPRDADAANGVWTGATNAAWATAGNWTGGIPNAAGDIADISQFDLTANQNINLAAANKTVGTLKVGDVNTATGGTGNTFNFTGTGGQLILLGAGNTAGTVEVVNRSATINTAVLVANEGFTKLGAGTLILSNPANVIAKGIALNAGVLSFASGTLGVFAADNLITTGGAVELTWNGHADDISNRIKLGDASTLTLTLNGNTTFANALQIGPLGTGALTKGSASSLTITTAQTYTGGTRINNGRLLLVGGHDRLSTAGALTFGNGGNFGVLQLGDAGGASNQTITGLTLLSNATVAASNAIVGGHSTNSILTINNATAIAAASVPTLGGAGANENNLALTKTGVGNLTLGKISTFAGNVNIAGGRLIITDGAALGTSAKTVTISGNTNAPSLQLNNAGGLAVTANLSYVTSNDHATTPAIVNTAGNNVIGGNIALAEGGFGGGHTRVLVIANSLTLNGSIAPAAGAASDRTLFLDGAAATTGTANGLLADNGAVKLAITKAGEGTWSLTAANTFTGPIAINGGRLNLTTAQTGTGALSAADGATLGLTLAAVGQSLAPSTLTLGASAGATLAFNLGSFANPSVPVITTGTFTTNGVTSVSIAGTGLGIGSFPLIQYAGVIGGAGFASFPVGNLPSTAVPARVTANLVDDAANSRVLLNISQFDVPKWIGQNGNVWDINDGPDPTTGIGTVNWREATSGTATRYLQTGSTIDSVLFDDTAGVPAAVDLSTTLTPTSVTVNTSLNAFVFTGAGKLSGATSLLKQGSTTLTLLNSGGNDYTGTTTIAAGTIQVGDGATVGAGQLGTGALLNNGALKLNRPDAITLANLISGSGSIEKLTASVLTISGNNSAYTGAIIVTAGTLKVGNANALGAATGSTTVASDAVLDVTGFVVGEPVQLDGATITSTTGAVSNLTGALTLNGGGIVEVPAGTLTLSGPIGGAGGLVKNNAGNLVLSGIGSFAGGFTSNGGIVTLSNAHTFTGGLTVNAGTTILSGNQAFTGGTIVAGGATLQIGGATTATAGAPGAGDIALISATGTATLNVLRGDSALVIANNITSSGVGTNAVTIGTTGVGSASGTVTFSGTNTFTGNVTINGGALKITNSSALGTGPKTVNIQANSRPSLQLDGSGGNIALDAGISYNLSSDGAAGSAAANPGAIVNLAGDNTINGHIVLTNGGGGNGKIVAAGGSLTLAGTIDPTGATNARALILGGAATGTVSGLINDWFDTGASQNRTVGVTKDGTGSWTLSGLNTFSGAVAVQDGTLKVNFLGLIGEAQPLGISTTGVTLGTVTTAGTLEYTGGETSFARSFSVTANGPGGTIKNSGGALLTLGGDLLRGNATSLTLTGGAFEITGTISGGNTASSTVISGAQVLLSNANTYAGATRVQGGGTLKNGATGVLPAATTLTLGEATNNTGGTYDLNGFDATVTGLASAGSGVAAVTNGGASGINTLVVTGTSSFAGTIRNGATASTALTKSTGGTFTLTGSSTYTGPTTVTGGTLAITGSLSGTTDVNLTGGTLLLGESDRINNSASLTLGGGTFSTSGFSEGTGTTAGLGSLILGASSSLDFGAGASVLHFTGLGSVTGGAVLAITNWDAGTDRLIFSGDETARLNFALPQDSISFNGASGYAAVQFDANNFEIVAVPEPSSTALLGAAGLLALVGYRERRRMRSLSRSNS